MADRLHAGCVRNEQDLKTAPSPRLTGETHTTFAWHGDTLEAMRGIRND